MRKKLLIISGITSTGKTSLGLKFAEKFIGEIISADSRQVYRGMDIGTGKDIPKNFEFRISNLEFQNKKIPFYGNGTKIWGYDLVEPDEEFSVAHFKKIAEVIIKDIQSRNKLPIIVGGTGLYLKVLTESTETTGIPPNNKLRNKLKDFSVGKLKNTLKVIDPIKIQRMNQSDRNNPRRLVRAIEIASFKKIDATPKGLSYEFKNKGTIFWIGLKANKDFLYKRIDARVDQRIKKSSEQEVKKLLKKGYNFDLPSMSAMGYREWKPYFEKKASKEEVIKRWKMNEHAYARRQLTWFKANKKINWFDISKANFIKNIVKQVSEWYSET
jgi:tRNA dimethylallyltransferase